MDKQKSCKTAKVKVFLIIFAFVWNLVCFQFFQSRAHWALFLFIPLAVSGLGYSSMTVSFDQVLLMTHLINDTVPYMMVAWMSTKKIKWVDTAYQMEIVTNEEVKLK